MTGKTHLEESAEEALVLGVRRLGGKITKVVPVTAGWPDRLILLPDGWMGLCELKRTDTDLSAVQRIWHERANAIGHYPIVLYGRPDVDRWLGLAAQGLQNYWTNRTRTT